MKYEIAVEERVPIRREFTVEVPDGEDDPEQYLRAHPELWQNPTLPPTTQDIAQLRPASPPTFLDPQKQLVLEWATHVEEQHRATLSVAELRQVLRDRRGQEPPPFSTVLDITAVIVGHAAHTDLDPWLRQLETAGRTRVSCATERIVEPAMLRPHDAPGHTTREAGLSEDEEGSSR